MIKYSNKHAILGVWGKEYGFMYSFMYRPLREPLVLGSENRNLREDA